MTDAAEAKVHVVNGALVQHLGLPAAYTIDAETELGGTVDVVWPAIAAEVVTKYDFADCRKLFKLTALSGAIDNGWRYGFALPAQRIGAPLAILDQAGTSEHLLREFLLEQGNIYTNVTPVWARCRFLLDPQYWDQGFAAAFRKALAGGLAKPLCQDEDLADRLTEDAFGKPSEQGSGGMFGKLIAVARGSEPQGRRFMEDDPLTNARRM
jgi:hypothetical protein